MFQKISNRIFDGLVWVIYVGLAAFLWLGAGYFYHATQAMINPWAGILN